MTTSSDYSVSLARAKMNGKPVLTIGVKTVLNLNSGFAKKLLCSGPTFSLGSLCAFSCSYCYVPSIVQRDPRVVALLKQAGLAFEDVVVRRESSLEVLRSQLYTESGKRRFNDPNDRRVVYSSPLVDVAANLELARETIEACRLILQATNWDIRLLSKSNLLPKIAQALAEFKDRVIYGVSTGTLDDKLAASFEKGTALVSKRIASLHWLQDHGFRTFGMICPSLPLSARDEYRSFAARFATALRADRCEHVFAEVMNVRGESMLNTVLALRNGGFPVEAALVEAVSTDSDKWDAYNQETFEAHADVYAQSPGKLRYLVYTTKRTEAYWQRNVTRGAILL